MPRVKITLKHAVDRRGVIHKLLWNASTDSPAMLMGRCHQSVASRPQLVRLTKSTPTCVLCLADDWEPS